MSQIINIIPLMIFLNSPSYALPCNGYANTIYQFKITDGNVSTYELVTFHRGGLVSIIDNKQHDFIPANSTTGRPFTSRTGEWICTRKNELYVRAFAYNYEASGILSSVIYYRMYLLFKPNGQSVTGNYTYAFYEIGDNPTKENVEAMTGESYGPYAIVGKQWIKHNLGARLCLDFNWCFLYALLCSFLLIILENY